MPASIMAAGEHISGLGEEGLCPECVRHGVAQLADIP